MKRLNTYAATAALMGALTLTACGSSLDHGTITGKVYVPARHWTYQQPIYTTQCHTVRTSGKTTGTMTYCSQVLTGYLPIPETDPACWKLNLRDGKETGHVCVSKHAWEKAKVRGTW
ncbi:hypothetical protein PV336_16335 [Streptomyces sp. MI02-2A]|uniref:hypothetical protein n=1 Tax=Streptomyces sp. MI02-2A TaxID=3028688 RepID=UPI0029BB231E|nr:hypothetical protein [Streptomyces sp. MI02-2A]MDX3260790.1 hypothetical protein [Streptomyces sp. MI02-2A]